MMAAPMGHRRRNLRQCRFGSAFASWSWRPTGACQKPKAAKILCLLCKSPSRRAARLLAAATACTSTRSGKKRAMTTRSLDPAGCRAAASTRIRSRFTTTGRRDRTQQECVPFAMEIHEIQGHQSHVPTTVLGVAFLHPPNCCATCCQTSQSHQNIKNTTA